MAVFTNDKYNESIQYEFEISPVLEMMACLRKVYIERENLEDIYINFYEKNKESIDYYYSNFENGAQLSELILSCELSCSVKSFLETISNLDKIDTVYYFLGRYISKDVLRDIFNNNFNEVEFSEIISDIITKRNGTINKEQIDFICNFEKNKEKLISLWSDFYKEIYNLLELELNNMWDESNIRLKEDLDINGFDYIYNKIVPSMDLPKQFPNSNTERVIFIPSKYIAPKFMIFWGYGDIIILYNALIYSDISANVASLAETANFNKIFSEEIRLKILLIIKNNQNISAQDLSRILKLSPSTVSRHLSLLKKNDCIIETKLDNINIYKINEYQIQIQVNSFLNLIC